jgi:hypothetical protein
MDVVCLQDDDGNYFCSEFFLKFRIPTLDSLILGTAGSTASSDLIKTPSQIRFMEAFPTATNGELLEMAGTELSNTYPPTYPQLIDIYVNNKHVKNCIAFIGEGLLLHFYDSRYNRYYLTPNQEILQSFSLLPGKNVIKCLHKASQTIKTFNIWVWPRNSNVVIMDIDGTITRSDVKGYIQTVYLGLYSYIHDGIIEFLNYLVSHYNYEILYLTARPMVHRSMTMEFLRGSKSDKGLSMPEGPLLMSRDGISRALYKEVILKDSVRTKSEILLNIVDVYKSVGDTRICPFVLGIGNKENDAMAYNSCGLSNDRILLIDTSSKIQIWKYSTSSSVGGTSSGLMVSATNPSDNQMESVATVASGKKSPFSLSRNNSNRQVPPTPPTLSRSNSNATSSSRNNSRDSNLQNVSVHENRKASLPEPSTPERTVVIKEATDLLALEEEGPNNKEVSDLELPTDTPPAPLSVPTTTVAAKTGNTTIFYTFNSYADQNLYQYMEHLQSQVVFSP